MGIWGVILSPPFLSQAGHSKKSTQRDTEVKNTQIERMQKIPNGQDGRRGYIQEENASSLVEQENRRTRPYAYRSFVLFCLLSLRVWLGGVS